MPLIQLKIFFLHGPSEFLHLILSGIQEFSSDELCYAANWIIQELRKECPSVSRVSYLFDSGIFQGELEKETPLTTNGIYSILHECQVFHHQELRFSVDDVPSFRSDIPIKSYVRHYSPDDELNDLLTMVENKQKAFCAPIDRSFEDGDVSFTEFLKKLENRQKDIMKKFQSVSFSSSDGDSYKGIELDLEALTDDVFQPQLTGPDQDVFFDSNEIFEKEPLLTDYQPWKTETPKNDPQSYLDKIIDELLGQVDNLGVRERNRRFNLDDDEMNSVEKKRVSEINMEISKIERDSHMEKVTKNVSDPRAKLSMTVATSTDVRGKIDQAQAETQTDKDCSGSEDEIAIIRHALSVIQKKRRKMSSISKKSPELKKKTKRTSRSPKCNCCEKRKERKEEKEEKKKETKDKKKNMAEEPVKSFNLVEELDKALPTSSEIDEPFNRKLREKWAHDGMKSLKKTTPIHSIRMPANYKLPNRFQRWEIWDGKKTIDDDFCDKYNLARLDGKLYKLVPRYHGVTTPLNKNYISQSTVPASIHMVIMDESDPWLNWENHYVKVYRALNVGSRTLKGVRVEVVYSNNMEISRNLSKVPASIPMDYTIDFELVFALIEQEKEGTCVMQLVNEDNRIVSPSFVFMGKKVDRLPNPALQSRVVKVEEPKLVVEEKKEEENNEKKEIADEKHKEEDEEEYEKVEVNDEKDDGSDFELIDEEEN